MMRAVASLRADEVRELAGWRVVHDSGTQQAAVGCMMRAVASLGADEVRHWGVVEMQGAGWGLVRDQQAVKSRLKRGRGRCKL